ncbi:MAG: hypothetical protein JRH08_00805 [Deltaproteobacteria bacterium]|nr:hypothetical protein [Deltaproteobacteria bacterium]MBW2025702.1 hypothetical protein [Deltaproteobacteria bacterium]MBW2124243.1 hypothetical protein [Deltaproteobacteria bacterium]
MNIGGRQSRRQIERELEACRLRCRLLIAELKAEYARYDRLKASLAHYECEKDRFKRLRLQILGLAPFFRKAKVQFKKWWAVHRR